MRTSHMIAGLGPLVVASLACGTGGALEQAAFETTCTESCTNEGTDRSQCETYCRCGYAWARDNNRLDDLNNAQTPAPGQRMAPVLEDLLVACGDDLWDTNFRRGCISGCTDGAVCEQRCDCMLRELRGTGPREESTRFLVQNLASDPPTAEGQARIDAAHAVCNP